MPFTADNLREHRLNILKELVRHIYKKLNIIKPVQDIAEINFALQRRHVLLNRARIYQIDVTSLRYIYRAMDEICNASIGKTPNISDILNRYQSIIEEAKICNDERLVKRFPYCDVASISSSTRVALTHVLELIEIAKTEYDQSIISIDSSLCTHRQVEEPSDQTVPTLKSAMKKTPTSQGKKTKSIRWWDDITPSSTTVPITNLQASSQITSDDSDDVSEGMTPVFT